MEWILYLALATIYFHIGGLATTNILRLTKGNTAPVNYPHCICDNCGYKIPPLLQFPVISYIISKGKCKNCGIEIPKYPLVLEIVVMCGMYLLTALFSYKPLGVFASFLYYEIIRIVMIRIRGKREEDFKKQYKVAVVSMAPFVLCCLFVVFLIAIV